MCALNVLGLIHTCSQFRLAFALYLLASLCCGFSLLIAHFNRSVLLFRHSPSSLKPLCCNCALIKSNSMNMTYVEHPNWIGNIYTYNSGIKHGNNTAQPTNYDWTDKWKLNETAHQPSRLTFFPMFSLYSMFMCICFSSIIIIIIIVELCIWYSEYERTQIVL